MHLLEQHYRKNRFSLVKRMSFRAGDYAEDIVQETYARALKYFSSYKGEFSLDAWMSRILNNCFKEHKNAEKGYTALTFEEEEQEGIPCNRFAEGVVAEIYELIDTKSLVAKEVLTYHFKYGYSAKEVQEITEYSYANCHQIISRFRQELKELYGKD